MKQTTTVKIVLFLCLFLSGLGAVQAQLVIESKLQLLNDTTWGVFIKHNGTGGSPSDNVLMITGQVSIVAPTGYLAYPPAGFQTGLDGGTWTANSQVIAPPENPTMDYMDFGYNVGTFPADALSDTSETLLFTFEVPGPCPDTIYLMDRNVDPFSPDNSVHGANPGQNSAGNNPGQNFPVRDIGAGGVYNWLRNYAVSAWGCEDCDGDGILDALEDTNGDGNWDPISEDVNGNGVYDSALDEDLNGDGNWDPISEDLNGNGVYDASIDEDQNGDGDFDPVSEDLNNNGLYDSCIDEDANNDGVFDVATEDLNGNGLWDTALDEDLDGDGNFDIIGEDLDGDGVYDPALDEDLDGDGNFNLLAEDLNDNGMYDAAMDEDLDGDGNFSLLADVSEACNACDPTHPLSAEIMGDTTMCSAEDNADFFVTINGGWNPYTIVYKDKNCNMTTVAGYESGDAINVTLTETDTFRVISVVDSRGCTVDTMRGQAIITIEGPLAIDADPVAVTECVGNGTSFSAPSSNGSISDMSITYNWQYSNNGGTNYDNLTNGTPYSSADTDNLIISDVDGLNGTSYRLAISTEYCDTVFSAWALLTVEGPIVIDLEPRDTAICSYETAQFYSTASAALGVVSGQWQYEDPANAGVWVNATGANFAGDMTGTLTVSNVTNYYDFKFRRQYTTPVCAIVNSAEALLTVEGPISITDQPDDISECSAQGLEFIVGVNNASTSAAAGDIIYQWQLSLDTTATWTNMANNGTYNGVRSDTLTVDVSDSLNGTWYRVLVWTNECNYIISDSAELSISGVVAFDLHPADIDICAGMDTILTTNATTAQGAFTYHWQVNKDDGNGWVDLPETTPQEGGVVYTQTTDDTLQLTGVTWQIDSFEYRAQARTTDCVPVSSEASILRVEGPLSVDTPPMNDTVCRAEQAVFEVVITNPGSGNLAYQWEVKPFGAGAWIAIPSNGTVYSGVFTDRFIMDTQFGGNDGDSVRVVVNTPTCATITSVGARLSLEGPVTITDAPNDTTVCSGYPVDFYAEFDNPNAGVNELRWELIAPGDINPTEIADGFAGFSGQATRILTIADVVGRDSQQFRLKVRTGDCDWVYSDWAVLTVAGPLSIDPGGDPDDVTTCDGGTARFWVEATNSGSGDINYLWEYRDRASGTWVSMADSTSGFSTDTLAVGPVSVFMNGDSVRATLWLGSCPDSVITTAGARLNVEAVVNIDTEPAPDTICSGGTANFNIAYTVPGGGAGTPALQWQVSTNGLGGPLGNWADISNGGVYGGVTLEDLVITAPDHTYNQYRYRVAYTLGTCGTLYTDDAVLTVEGAISITADPIDVQSCDSQDEVFFVSTQNLGGGVDNFQWQLNTGSGFTDIDNSTDVTANYQGFTSEVLAIGQIGDYMNGYTYQLVMNTGDCAAVTSAPASLTVEGPLEFTNHPDDITVCSGSDTIMVVEFTNTGNSGVAGTNIQWVYSSNGGNTWLQVPDDAQFDNVTDDTLVINDVANLYDYWFRAQISTTTCPIVESDPAVLTVEGPISGTSPTSLTDCSNNSIRFTSVVTNSGSGNVDLQWQTWDGAAWIDMANDTSQAGQFNGVRTDTLSISDINADSLNGTRYRMRMRTSTCMTQYTTDATLTIEGPLTITDSPNDTIVCSGEPAEFYMSVDLGQGGTATYQWQRSTDGVTFVDIDGTTDGGIYSDFDTRILLLSDVSNRYGHYYRCAVNTTYCDIKYTLPARLGIEGPITITNQPDSLIACRNEAYFFQTEVTNGGASAMTFQWEVYDVGSMTWSDMADDTWIHGTGTGLLQLDSMDYMQTNGDTIFRMRIDLPTCNPYYSDTVLLHIVSDTLGFCDFDMDGEINDIDLDDDNDGLDDVWEYSCLNYAQFDMDVDNDGDFDGEEDWDGDGISNGEETDGDGVLDGDPCDPCDPLVSSNCFGISLEVDAMLFGGAYDGITFDLGDKMNDDLREKGLIPLTEPYSYDVTVNGSDFPFVHYGPGGGETIADSAAVLGDRGDSSIVDWVFIELRHANKIDSIVATRAALITKVGDIVDVDGKSHVNFDLSVVAGEYYVAVRHRNHLGAMTVDAPELSPITNYVDFKDTNIEFQGDHPMFRDTSAFMDFSGPSDQNFLWAGDLRPDGKVIYQGPNNDITQVLLKVLTDPNNDDGPNGSPNANYILDGYLLEDYDLDGKAIYQGPDNDRIMVLLGTILNHPGNENTLANFIVIEQLP